MNTLKNLNMEFVNWLNKWLLLKKLLILFLIVVLITSFSIIFYDVFGESLGMARGYADKKETPFEMTLKVGTRLSIIIMTFICMIYAVYVEGKKYMPHQKKEHIKEHISGKKKSTAFLESISHEIRTPLNGIIGYAEFIQHTSKESMIQFPAQIIYENSQHLLRLIDNLLDLTEIETQRKKMNRNSFILNSSIDDLLKSRLTRSYNKNISLRYEFDPKCPKEVILDETLFRKIISNLIDNAIVFSKDIGEIVLSVHYLKSSHALYIAIKDDGFGIPEKMHSHVFDKFWQIGDFISNAHGGSALGLAITQKMVALMGGEINFNSSENVGSIFYFTLPLEENGHEK